MKKMPWKLFFLIVFFFISVTEAQDYKFDSDKPKTPPAPPPAPINCNGIYLTYQFLTRTKEYPHLKNVTAQPWSFTATATILNTGIVELKSWKIYIGFQHQEVLVSASGAVIMDGNDFPAHVGNGTFLSGYPQTDLKTSIDTAGDLTQIQAEIQLAGTTFGLKPPAVPMPKTIRLANDGYKCPAPSRKGHTMSVCCVKDLKYKAKVIQPTKFLPRQATDLSIVYDIMQAYKGSYLAQITMDNLNPLGRLDNWNLTWEWMRGEFIYSMRGAYPHLKDYSECMYGPQGKYYQDFDFSQALNCQKHPIISDLPPEKETDEKLGKLPYCCKNGTLLPTTMNATKARAIFQMQVYKIAPDINVTAFYPPQKWKIKGLLNPDYKCAAPIRIDASEFPDPGGLPQVSTAIASWQVACNITKPKKQGSRCCVSFSAFYNDSVIPCNTCACGCGDSDTCNKNAQAMLLPPEALLVPFNNRTDKAKAWAKIKHHRVPKPLPCGDNCGVSINWHVNSDYRNGWTVRMTLFNWEEVNFVDWFAAVQMNAAYPGYESTYSFNGTKLKSTKNTLFFQGLPGLKYLMAEANGTGTNPKNLRVPGKQQSVISFKKKGKAKINVVKGDGFPSKVFFNGEECALPTGIPIAAGHKSHVKLLPMIFLTILTFILITDHICG